MADTSPFRGLSAFPLTPLDEHGLDLVAFRRIVERLAAAGVDSVTALGSTGSYAYLTREERSRVARGAVEAAGEVPVLVGVGALRTKHVLEHVADAQEAGAAGVLLAPVSYQPLTPDEVYGLYADVTAELSVPLVVYDNPRTTNFAFSHDLYAAVARLPRVASIKIPGVPVDPDEASRRIAALRALLPDTVTLGVSGDAFGAAGLTAGCAVWYSVIAGTLPDQALAIARAVQGGDAARAAKLSNRLQPLWDLFARLGSIRVTAAIAEEVGLVRGPSLPRPLLPLVGADRAAVAELLDALGLRD